jgi:ABC-type multidrug transport system fused ATPase/permease subunit
MPNYTDPAFRVVSLFFGRKRIVLLLLGLVVAAAGFDIAIAFLTQGVIDSLVKHLKSPTGYPVRVLLTSAAAILAATALTRAIRSLYNYQLFRTVTRIEDELKHRAFEGYLRLDALFHHNSNSGQIISRIENGCASVFTVLFDVLGQSLIPPLVIFTGVLASLLAKNPWIALAVFLPVPVYLAVVSRLTSRIYAIEQQGCEEFEAVSKERFDVAGNVLTVKKFSRERAEIAAQRRLQDKARGTQFRGERLWAVVENAQSLIATLGRVSVIAVAGLFVLSGRCTVGEFFLYVTLSDMAYSPVCQLSIIFPRLRRSMARAERLFGVLDQAPAIVDKPGARRLPPLSDRIEFRNVWFRYAEDRHWALRDANVTIAAGATVALVGRSGSGKTTFMNLLLRLFDPQSGAILIDGIDLRDVTEESLRSQIAVVPQEVDLFSRTIAQNIVYGKAGATPAEVERAARVALAHDFISRTEHGYDTLVGERGLKLSGGERQRIGIARAILRDPGILILDEATSHLDTESEQLIQIATEAVIRGRTSFVIAHRLSTVLHADVTLVFKDGTIEAAGTHRELLRKSPTYQSLFSLYLKGAPSLTGSGGENTPSAPANRRAVEPRAYAPTITAPAGEIVREPVA